MMYYRFLNYSHEIFENISESKGELVKQHAFIKRNITSFFSVLVYSVINLDGSMFLRHEKDLDWIKTF